MKKRNPIALELRSPKYKKRVVKPKKGKGSYKRNSNGKKTLFRVIVVKMRMWWADFRGHHGKVWNYEPGDYYMGSHKGHNKHKRK